MVSFSLRQRITLPPLQDPAPVSFHLSQFADEYKALLALYNTQREKIRLTSAEFPASGAKLC